MNNSTQLPWDNLGSDQGRLVDPSCQFEFFWAKVNNQAHALVLFLNDEVSIDLELPKFSSIEVYFQHTGSKQALVIALSESTQISLFYTLCTDIVAYAQTAANESEAVSRTLRRTIRWHMLLKGERSKELTLEQQRGLFGELTFLREIASKHGIRYACSGWMGPTGSPKDFELTNTCCEIKSKRSASSGLISISSADQLTDVIGQDLYLIIYSIDEVDDSTGVELHNLVAAVMHDIGADFDTTQTFYERLYEYGYEETHVYNNRRWIVRGMKVFSVGEGFPRITLPLPPGVSHVKYDLSMDAIAQFETKHLDF